MSKETKSCNNCGYHSCRSDCQPEYLTKQSCANWQEQAPTEIDKQECHCGDAYCRIELVEEKLQAENAKLKAERCKLYESDCHIVYENKKLKKQMFEQSVKMQGFILERNALVDEVEQLKGEVNKLQEENRGLKDAKVMS